MVDIRAELEKKILESKQNATSLSERLKQLDEFNQGTAVPQISSQGPKGYNPMNSLNALFQMISNRKSVAGDVESERNVGANLLQQLSQYEQANQPEVPKEVDPYDAILKQLNLEKAAKDVGKTINFETGEITKGIDQEALDVLDLIADIKNDNLKPVTGTLRIRSGIKGTKAFDTKQKITRLRDSLALKARAAIKGTGTISDIEQEMLKNAQTLLQPGLSEKEFRAELDRLEKNAMKSAGVSSKKDDYSSLVDKYW